MERIGDGCQQQFEVWLSVELNDPKFITSFDNYSNAASFVESKKITMDTEQIVRYVFTKQDPIDIKFYIRDSKKELMYEVYLGEEKKFARCFFNEEEFCNYHKKLSSVYNRQGKKDQFDCRITECNLYTFRLMIICGDIDDTSDDTSDDTDDNDDNDDSFEMPALDELSDEEI